MMHCRNMQKTAKNTEVYRELPTAKPQCYKYVPHPVVRP